MTDLPKRLSAAQVSVVLQRAAEIDAKGDSLTIEELRRIAEEAGIDPGATSTALQEIVAEEEPDRTPAPAGSPGVPAKKTTSLSPGRMVTGGAMGMALGFIAAMADYGVGPDFLPILAGLGFGGTVLYLIVRAVHCIRRGAQLDFQLQNFALWFGTLVGALATDLYTFADDEIGLVFLIWLVTSVVGALLVRLGPREEQVDG